MTVDMPPRGADDASRTAGLKIEDLTVRFGSGRDAVTVLNRVSLTVDSGSTLGLVGESGSGKSTLAKAIVGLVHVHEGRMMFHGEDLVALRGSRRRKMRRRIQLIPQDPFSSLDPRRTIGQTLGEAIDPVRSDPRRHRETIEHWLGVIRLDADVMERYPHEFSGGQRQRLAIARALVIEPELIIADEITSALDLSVQAEILNLMSRLRRELNFTMLFISHNLAVVRHVSDQMAVMYRGDIKEIGDAEDVFLRPSDPYTKELLASVPGGPRFDIDSE